MKVTRLLYEPRSMGDMSVSTAYTRMRSMGRPMLPLQVDRAVVGSFILPKLAKGKAAFFDLVTEHPRLPPVILVKRAKAKLLISHQE